MRSPEGNRRRDCHIMKPRGTWLSPSLPLALPILGLMWCVVGCSRSSDQSQVGDYLTRRHSQEVYNQYRRAGHIGSERDQCIHLLFVNAYYLDGEFDLPVSLLLDIAEQEPRRFFRVVADHVSADTYESWLGKISSACFTDFSGDHDLKSMEARRTRVASKLRNLELEDRKQDGFRERLARLLEEEIRVRRIG